LSLSSQEQIEYGVASASDESEIVRLIATAFSASEPLAKAMKLSVAEMAEFLRPLMPAAFAQGLTIVARRQGSDELAGALLNDDLASPLPVDPSRLDSKYLPIITLLETLEEHYNIGRTIAPGECLHLFMLAVDERFKGHGIGRGLVRASLEYGARRGYRAAVTEATAGASQHIFRALGFAERFPILYQDFVYEGKAVFGSIQDPPSAILMDKSLLE
jgi:ribosomal protein S18 acetylase RimI-like enzyme